jgi:hypothetical protein
LGREHVGEDGTNDAKGFQFQCRLLQLLSEEASSSTGCFGESRGDEEGEEEEEEKKEEEEEEEEGLGSRKAL